MTDQASRKKKKKKKATTSGWRERRERRRRWRLRKSEALQVRTRASLAALLLYQQQQQINIVLPQRKRTEIYQPGGARRCALCNFLLTKYDDGDGDGDDRGLISKRFTFQIVSLSAGAQCCNNCTTKPSLNFLDFWIFCFFFIGRK